MIWWLWAIVALSVYLLVSMTPWIALQFVIWRIRRKLPFMADETRRLDQLMTVESEHARRWPERPRAGRYQQVDQQALEQLVRMRVIISQTNDLWPAVADYVPGYLAPWQILALGAWRPLVGALQVWRDKRHLDALLDEGDEAIDTLLEQWTEAQSIPARIQAELADARAEARRLQALWEGETEAGSRGIEALGDALALLERALGDALSEMRTAQADQVAATALQSEHQLSQAVQALQAMELELDQVIQGRKRAEESLARAATGQAALKERWQGMQALGARDPAVAQRLLELGALTDALGASAQPATPQAHEQVLVGMEAFYALEKTLGEQLDTLQEIMQRSHEALAGDVSALAAAQQACDAQQASGKFAPDRSQALVVQAQEIYAQAEQQHSQGTLHGYQTAIALAEQAQQAVQEAAERMEQAKQEMAQIEADLGQTEPEIRQSLRERAEGAGVALGAYTRHWDEASAAKLERINTLLEQADAAWTQVPASLLGHALPKQSELAGARESLLSAAGAVRRARQLVEDLEGRLARISAQRKALETGLAELDNELGPRLVSAREAMLPELRDRCDAWLSRYEAQRSSFQDASLINYDQAADQWLPGELGQAREILAAHQEDIARYGKLAQDARRNLEREWQRLQKLDPLQMPLPEEDMERLAADYDEWQAETSACGDSPAAMSELVSRRVAGLERRIELARRQISQGRQALAVLDRQFEQQVQAIQKSRASVRALMQESQWRQIDWALTDGEPLVQRAITYQEASREAELLDEAVHQMRRAVGAAEEALQAYVGMEQQLVSAQEGLNREFRAAATSLDRAQRQAGQLRAQGPSETLRALEERCASATSLISMAQGASTFEDALRHLREAQERLARG